MSGTKSLVVLLSGSGRSLENLLQEIDAGRLPCRISGVIASKGGIRGIEIAEGAGLPVAIIRRRDFDSVADFSAANTRAIESFGCDLVVMAGYLSFYELPDQLSGRVINIHPSLLPLFGGRGFYGHHVHEAVLEAGVRVSGCTVHFVDNAYDTGPCILQWPVPVLPGDDADTLAARVFARECRALPLAIRWILEGRATWADGRVRYADDLEWPDF